MLALQRGAGNHAVASLLSGPRSLARAIPAGAKAGQMVKHTADGKLYTITKAELDKDMGEMGYTVEDEKHSFLIPASTRDFTLVEPKEQLLAIDQDPNADFSQAVMAADAEKLNALVTDAAFLNTMHTTLTAERFALLAAAILLISKHAPGARAEALRLLAVMYGDKGTAFRMLKKPFKTVIVPRNKQMTELDEFKGLLTNDSGAGPGRTFDGRWWAHTRGVGDVVADGKHYAAITEENLLGGDPDPTVFAAPRGPAGTPGTAGPVAGGYTAGYSTTTHEMAHAIHRYGLRNDQKAVITSAYAKKRAATATAATIGTVPVVRRAARGSERTPALDGHRARPRRLPRLAGGDGRRRQAPVRELRVAERGGVLRPGRQRLHGHEHRQRRHDRAAAQQRQGLGPGRGARAVRAARGALQGQDGQRARGGREAQGRRHVHEPGARTGAAAAAARVPPGAPVNAGP